MANDVSVFEWYVEDGKLLEYEKDMYEAALNKLESASIPPKGISAAGGYMKTEAARDYLREFFASRWWIDADMILVDLKSVESDPSMDGGGVF